MANFHAQLDSSQPIGIFDSGVGGLTVAKALIETLPKENIIYFGDTLHFPWGDKSSQAIQCYAQQVTEFLIKKNCKLVLIACNSASAAAYEFLHNKFNHQVLLLNVVDPIVDFLINNYSNKHVGLIATKLTVNSNIYGAKISAHKSGIKLSSQATPLVTMAIEEGLFNHKIIDSLLEIYLNDSKLQYIDALVLGCTHYPLIQEQVRKFYKNQVDIIDASKTIAIAARDLLQKHNLLNSAHKNSQNFYISDYTISFADSAKLFFGEDIVLEKSPLS